MGERERTCTHHCTACGRHFHGLEAFDLHRVGSHAENTRACEWPMHVDELGIWASRGVCRSTGASPVIIWGAKRSAAASERLGGAAS